VGFESLKVISGERYAERSGPYSGARRRLPSSSGTAILSVVVSLLKTRETRRVKTDPTSNMMHVTVLLPVIFYASIQTKVSVHSTAAHSWVLIHDRASLSSAQRSSVGLEFNSPYPTTFQRINPWIIRPLQ